MARTTAHALHATGVAMLEEDEEALVHLLELVEGDAAALRDARVLLRTLDASPDRVERADAVIERALHHVEEEPAPGGGRAPPVDGADRPRRGG